MSNLAKRIMDNAREKGAVREGSDYFSVTDSKTVDAGGGEMVTVKVPNGMHHVKILSEKLGKGKGFDGSEQEELQMTVLDNGKQKLWNVAVKNRDTGKVSYIVEALEDIEIGEVFAAEAFKMKNGKYGTKISKVVSGGTHDEVPTVQLDDRDSEGTDEPSEDGSDVPFEDIQLPF